MSNCDDYPEIAVGNASSKAVETVDKRAKNGTEVPGKTLLQAIIAWVEMKNARFTVAILLPCTVVRATSESLLGTA